MTKVHVHELTGLKPDALATYLAALGVMRLLAEQKDANIRGFWRNEHFVLATELDSEAIERFFLEDYAPTPILAPWSGGGGFLDNADEKDVTATNNESDNDDLIEQFAASAASRFEAVRIAIAEAQRVIPPSLPLARGERDRLTARLREVNRSIKQLPVDGAERQSAIEQQRELGSQREAARNRVEEVKNAVKATLLRQTKRGWVGAARDWFDAAVILGETGDPSYSFHLGTGGNEGNQDYTAGFQRNLILLFDLQLGTPKPNAKARLDAVLFGRTIRVLSEQTVGQFSPGRAGGINMGAGFDGAPGINPWEFLLMLEGAVALVAGMSRRADTEKARVSSPFWVEGASAGFGSASSTEKSKGPPRGEQWLPGWSQPLRYDEFVELVREGRAQVGRRQTTRAADLVRAAARLGLARGIDSLQRFAYLQRNGDSTFAVSAGRIRVASLSHQALLDEVAPWIDRLAWQAREKNAPASLGVIALRTQEALFTLCRREATAMLWREILVTLGDAELVLLRTGKSPARRPLPRLSSGWLAAVDDGTEEGRTALRLALALASQHRPRERNKATPLVDSVRRHFLPLADWDVPSPRFKLDQSGNVQPDIEHVCVGRDLVTDAIALVERRSIWARSLSSKRERAHQLPLEAARGCTATLEEIGAWVRSEIPDEAVFRLVRPLLALDWGEVERRGSGVPIRSRGMPDPLHMLFRLAHLPFDVPVQGPDERTEVEVTVRLDPEPLRRLAAGDLDGALKVTIRRLDASSLRPVFRRGVATPGLARRLAASLAFPISRDAAARAARLVCKPYDVNDAVEVPSTPV